MHPSPADFSTKQDNLNLIHLLDQSIDLLLPISQIATLDKVLELPRSESAGGIAQLERPEKVARLFKVWPNGDDLVHQVLHADDTEFTQLLLDDLVIGESDALLVDLAVAALVDEVAYRFDARVAVGDVGFYYFEHFQCCFREFDKDAVVDLEETEELKDFAGFGGNFVDTVRSVRVARGGKDDTRGLTPLCGRRRPAWAHRAHRSCPLAWPSGKGGSSHALHRGTL